MKDAVDIPSRVRYCQQTSSRNRGRRERPVQCGQIAHQARPEPLKQSPDTSAGKPQRPTESLRHGDGPQPSDADSPARASGRPNRTLESVVKLLRRDLKVCEGCGGLWVRTGIEAGVYCRHCSPFIAALPARRRRSPGRPCRSTAASVRTEQTGRPEVRLHLVHARCHVQSSDGNQQQPAGSAAAEQATEPVNQSIAAAPLPIPAVRLAVVTKLAVPSSLTGGAQ